MEKENENDNVKCSELTDEELKDVAGGSKQDGWKKKAAEDGRTIRVEASAQVSDIFVVISKLSPSINCSYCGKDAAEGSIYAKQKAIVNNGPDEFRDCKCYHCNVEIGNVNVYGHKVS